MTAPSPNSYVELQCTRCEGTGKLPREFYNRVYCFDCQEFCSTNYMVHDSTWAKAVPNYEEIKDLQEKDIPDPRLRPLIILCLPCLSKRLGRKLTVQDFPTDIPVNVEIRKLFSTLEFDADSAPESETSP